MPEESPDTIRPLRLDGGRFERASRGGQTGLPLAAARELARYDDLVFDVARRLWRREHPGANQIPRDFEEKVRLRLTGVEEGSVNTVMRSMLPPGGIGGAHQGYGDRARATIVAALIAFNGGGSIPRDFPPESLPALARIAQSLKDNETAVLASPSGEEISHRRDDQKRLKQFIDSTRPRDGRILALVTAINPDGERFEARVPDGRKVNGHFSGDDIEAALRDVTTKRTRAPYVALDCAYRIDASERVVSIEAVRVVTPISSPDDPLGDRLRHLIELQGNWDGQGAEPVAINALDLAQRVVRACAAAGIPLPHAFLTREGGVLLEEQPAATRWSLEIDSEGEMLIVIAGGGVLPQYLEPETPEQAAASLKAFVA